MAETPVNDGDRPARELVSELLPHLEAVANLHYLLDGHLVDPERMKELRVIEDEAFEAILEKVLRYR